MNISLWWAAEIKIKLKIFSCLKNFIYLVFPHHKGSKNISISKKTHLPLYKSLK